MFFFGSEIGDTGASNTSTIAKVTASDTSATQTHGAALGANIPITNIYDFNKDGQVTGADTTDAQTHGTTSKTGLNFIQLLSAGPFAPPPDGPSDGAASVTSTDSGMASALTGSANSQSLPPPPMPAWIANRLGQLDLNSAYLSGGPLAKYFEYLALDESPKATATAVNGDQGADAMGPDNELLDPLLVKSGLG